MKTPDYSHIVNPDRIAWCCDQTNITLAELGKSLKISPKRLQEGRLTSEEARMLWEYFGYSHFFFIAKGVPKKPAHANIIGMATYQQDS